MDVCEQHPKTDMYQPMWRGGGREGGPAIKSQFTRKTNKSQHVILSFPAPLTAALHS